MQHEGRMKPPKDVSEERKIPEFPRTYAKILPPKLPLEVHSSRVNEFISVTKYLQKDEIELNGLVSVAQENGRLGTCVLVRQMSNESLYRELRILAQFRRQRYFPKTIEIFFSGSMVDVVCEYVDLNLLHISESLRIPTEKELAAIGGQESLLYMPVPFHVLIKRS
ncbi:hypothetical protein LTR84_010585 [Exophiala bonariae]|uniref:Uncharacterized protein n=1 Tax=Exophiala bonariae TaxID=1690606 RepID=A0AAV9MSX2_9EURO|nr:hypothetical protein LTR84_010585 [Exophiala bonariae]